MRSRRCDSVAADSPALKGVRLGYSSVDCGCCEAPAVLQRRQGGGQGLCPCGGIALDASCAALREEARGSLESGSKVLAGISEPSRRAAVTTVAPAAFPENNRSDTLSGVSVEFNGV